MKPIVTLTLNPAIDGACETDLVRPTHKIRTRGDAYHPGGGGINVARVIRELGGRTTAVYLAGGATGSVLDELMAGAGLVGTRVPIAGHTRISLTVFEASTGQEYRFVPEGPEVSPAEWLACLETVDELDFDWLVISGSGPRGLPPDCFVTLTQRARDRGARVVLDSSGPALKASLEAGGLTLIKPSLGELRALTGLPLEDRDEVAEVAREIVESGRAEIVAVTMGHEGALLASREANLSRAAPDVPVRSATGAGDSFVGAMTLALAEGKGPRTAFLVGMAAGSASVMHPGTDLCRRADVERLHAALVAG
ncbi:1-phosphofructokinase family hexose kinase [Amaricoccus solimangrovi]|uniref:Phosphofructokinase n=1 Tax=Amaricoccus solimangrovi TaxID=2589815 RepID=A0A501WTL8_9RHOB|nr:1-phosphofructokinase family hexose kinase [Amaricoccus solimangrovi]TPE52748.1 1-phosphofructokinase family hexose kinase [Amaricoccus solimangrovi]